MFMNPIKRKGKEGSGSKLTPLPGQKLNRTDKILGGIFGARWLAHRKSPEPWHDHLRCAPAHHHSVLYLLCSMPAAKTGRLI